MTPLMIAEGALSSVLNGTHQKATVETNTKPRAGGLTAFSSEERIGIINVWGTLFSTDYRTLGHIIEQMAGQNAKIILDINSPGGEVAGCFDVADKIKAIGLSTPIYAVVDDMAFSAAYCIASACKAIYCSRTAGLGSIGVMCAHINQSGYDSKLGVDYSLIHAGAKKIDRSIHAPLSDQAKNDMQHVVDGMYGIFSTTVSQNRGMTIDAVKNTEAGLFYGIEAKNKGLADYVCSYDQAIQHITDGKTIPSQITSAGNPSGASMGENPLIANAKARAAAATRQTQTDKRQTTTNPLLADAMRRAR